MSVPSSINQASNLPPAHYGDVPTDVTAAMTSLVRPGSGNINCVECMATATGVVGARLTELKSVPTTEGQRLLALRYLLENGRVWLKYFSWQKQLATIEPGKVTEVTAIYERLLAAANAADAQSATSRQMLNGELSVVADALLRLESDEALQLLGLMSRFPELRVQLRDRVRREGPGLIETAPELLEQLFLLTQDLTRFPPTTTSAKQLHYVIVADKGEMGTRAVRETLALGMVPIVVYSKSDDDRALQVRIAQENGGFSIPLTGSFRETYANPGQMAERILSFYHEQWSDQALAQLRRSALYPGYGPLAENTAAIELFRRNGIVFIGPMQDVVERAGDKRMFRLIAQSIDPSRVTPGIVMDESEALQITSAIEEGARQKKFLFPGRLKAANGGGGRGQVVIESLDGVPAAVSKVLGEIQANGWDKGVMFEQNIFQTTHLEVQVLRDRFGNTRHFGMRDCTEQRASQKIQEEAPPALLRAQPELEAQMCAIAVRIADSVDYVGACTIELMYKGGHFYLLEMNTRIQVEHPVTEEAHRIKRGEQLTELNLVQLQLSIASGLALDFEQSQVVQTHFAREFRINAESYKPSIKDPRDGKLGLFLPNAGVFDEIKVPSSQSILEQLGQQGVLGIDELIVRFDCGFEPGDVLLNKDPTFGKLIVAVRLSPAASSSAFELLRQASIAVLREMRIVGRQVLPNGRVLEDRPFETNLLDHIAVLESEVIKQHSTVGAPQRHVNWLIEELRSCHA